MEIETDRINKCDILLSGQEMNGVCIYNSSSTECAGCPKGRGEINELYV
jgi:hypothetical protein